MGLDIRAKSHTNVLGFAQNYNEDWEDSSSIHPEFINSDFPHAVPDEFIGNKYVIMADSSDTETHSFRAGSYGGYGEFRRTLAMGTDVHAIWHDPHRFADKPFLELICFSDCEGVMSGPVCEKLYNDFVNTRNAYVEYLIDAGPLGAWPMSYYVDRYEDWTEAFRLASQSGYVAFH